MKTNSRESTLPGIVVWSLQTHLLALNCFVLENFGVKLKLLRVFCSCFLNLLFEATFRPLTHISTLRSSPIHFQFLLNEDTLVGLWQYLLCFEIFTKWLFMFVNQFAILSLSITPKCCFITSRFFVQVHINICRNLPHGKHGNAAAMSYPAHSVYYYELSKRQWISHMAKKRRRKCI